MPALPATANAKAAEQMSESAISTFDKVREIIAGIIGADPASMAMDSDIAADLGVAGDDGNDLFGAFGEAFDVDWTGLDLGIHFGNEGYGLPWPWQLKNNCLMYESQPCRVSDVVRAVETGCWPGTQLVLLPKSKRFSIFLLSTLQLLLLAGMLIAATLSIILAIE